MGFYAASYSGLEGTTVTVKVKRTGGFAAGATVDYAATGGTATASVDYMLAPGTLTFGANERIKTFDGALITAGTAQANQSAILTRSSPGGGAVLGRASTTILTIQDADDSLTFATPAVFVSEASTSVALKVNRTGSLMSTATVQYATNGGTATSNVDFTQKSG